MLKVATGTTGQSTSRTKLERFRKIQPAILISTKIPACLFPEDFTVRHSDIPGESYGSLNADKSGYARICNVHFPLVEKKA